MSLIATDESVVNTYKNNSQSAPSIALLANGGWIVTWVSAGQDGNLRGVFQQRFQADGSPVGPETQVNTETLDNQLDPSVTGLPDGGWVVTWISLGQDGNGWGIYQQRFDAMGGAVGGETQVNTEIIADQKAPAVSALADGGWIVTWTSLDQDGDGYGIYQQRFDSNGAMSGGEILVNTETTLNQQEPCVTALAGGGWVVSWRSEWQDGDDGGIYFQRFNADGSPAGVETLVNTVTDGTQHQPSIAALADGGFVATWSSDGQDGDQYGIFQQRYDLNGAPVGQNVQVNTETFEDQITPAVTGLANGGWVVSWVSLFQDGEGNGVYLQWYNADGTPNGGEYQVNTETKSNQSHPTITALADGGFVVAWDSFSPGNGSIEVVQKVFHPAVNVAPGGTDKAITIDEDSKHDFSASDFGFSDTQYDQLRSVIINNIAGDGLLTLDGNIVKAGDVIAADMLDLLRWKPTKDAAGQDIGKIIFQVVDNGGTTGGGMDIDPEPNTITFHVNQINDAPSGTATRIVVNLEKQHHFAAADFGFTDLADGNHLLSVILTTVPQAGTMTLAGAPVLAGQEIAVGELGSLLWKPPADGAGTAAFLFQVRDDGGTLNGGEDLEKSPNSFEIVYGPHQAPEGFDFTLYAPEDQAVRFSTSQFQFFDQDGDQFKGIVISDLPASGKLTLDGKAVAAGDFIAKGEIAGLAWKPPKNAFGDDLGNFSFQVVDNGILDKGGENTDQTPSLMTIHVSDVLDRFIGTAGRNRLTGTDGKDILDGRAGNDRLTGKAAGDIFIFRAKDGRDVVTDFETGAAATDVIDIRKIAAITDFADLVVNHMREANGNVIIDHYGTSRITLLGVTIAELTADDFLI